MLPENVFMLYPSRPVNINYIWTELVCFNTVELQMFNFRRICIIDVSVFSASSHQSDCCKKTKYAVVAEQHSLIVNLHKVFTNESAGMDRRRSWLWGRPELGKCLQKQPRGRRISSTSINWTNKWFVRWQINDGGRRFHCSSISTRSHWRSCRFFMSVVCLHTF